MKANIARMEIEITNYIEEIASLRDQNRVSQAKIDDFSIFLKERDTLEEAVRKQHDLIEKQTEELKTLKKQLEERDKSLDKAK